MNNQKIFLTTVLVCVTIILIIVGCAKASSASSISANSAVSPRIWTDKADYNPGQIVTIYGTGFLPNSDIALNVTKLSDNNTTSWTAISSTNGSFVTTYQIDKEGAPLYSITATDGVDTAKTTFTDQQYYLFTVNYSVNDLTTPPTSPTFTYYDNTTGNQTTVSLTTTSATYEVTPDTAWSLTQIAYANSSEQWTADPNGTGTNALSGTATNDTTLTPVYYDQFMVSFAYTTNDGTTLPSTLDLVNYTQFNNLMELSSTGTYGVLSAASDWVDAGTSVNFTSPIEVSSNEQYMIDASDNSTYTVIPSVMSGSVSADPIYYHQYYFQLDYSISGGGSGYSAPILTSTQFGSSNTTTLTTSLVTYWLDGGESWSVTNPLGGSGSSEQWYSSQPASGTVGASSPTATGGFLTFTYNHQFKVTFTASSNVLGDASATSILQIGGSAVSVSYTSGWINNGSSVTFAYQSPVASSGSPSAIQYVWSSNSGLGQTLQGNTFTVTAAGTVTATYATQYKVTFTESGLTSDAGSNTVLTLGSNTYTYSSFSGDSLTAWENSGATYTWSTTVAGLTNEQFITSTNTGTISSASSGDSTAYTKQYYLTVNSSYGSPTGQNWYNAGSTASFSVTTPVSGGTGIQYTFTSWGGSGTGSYSGTSSSQSVTMNNPIKETASWQTQYCLTVNENFGTVSPSSGWVNASSTLNITATSPSPGSGEQYVFNGWTGTGSGSYSGVDNPASITMNAPINETASWAHQYYLTVNSAYGTVNGNGWYISGSTAYAQLNSGTAAGTTGTQYVFVSWTDDASGTNYAQSSSITMNSPKTVNATWQTQYQITFNVNPLGSGTTTPTGTSVWENAGSLNISAVPNKGYLFSSWSSTAGPVTNTAMASTTVTINQAGTITADFESTPLDHFTISTISDQVSRYIVQYNNYSP